MQIIPETQTHWGREVTRYQGYRATTLAIGSLKRSKYAIQSKADLTGKRFGRLLVERDLGPIKSGWRLWGCVCDCSERVAVRSRELSTGNTRSCGCFALQQLTFGGQNRLPYGHASRNELLTSYKKSAAQRGLPWEISAEEFFELSASNCSFCGGPPDLERKPNAGVNGGYFYTGVDRLDNSIGYAPGNVVSCCWICNRAKGTLSVEEFLVWCRRLAAYGAARSARFEHGEQG